jgi:hypothetical protein
VITFQGKTLAWVEYKIYYAGVQYATEETMAATIAKCDRNPGSVAYAIVWDGGELFDGPVASEPREVYRS